ncbi:4-alpha-glucanotransferase [Paracoccus hibiscisoli]|uniref:4-alpha-glucanotransferase n=1 Tax=Paracoccus hibiscisoli TaxID=2023261 RepID=A0A4V5MTU7_9RHOB|nr:4-alpha-glucanotransferase [Paracoccus hibiscisoli]TJZ85578.1 4-alpha-glucanotransferase [Paracoccus hibiscisoli]
MTLRDRARAYGIQPQYDLVGGAQRDAPDNTLRGLLQAFGADRLPPLADEPQLVAPPGAQCHVPGQGRHWGIALQLYQLRSARNWGIGDFADLQVLAGHAAQAGAAFLGLNPLHAMFLADPSRCSPFSPSNRRFLNPLYLAVDAVPGFDPAMADAAALHDLRAAPLVDYPAVAAAKLAALRAIWAKGATVPEAFRAEGGDDLYRHALFEVVSTEMVAQGHGAGWLSWPEAWRAVDGEAVRTLADRRSDDIAFHMWLQYLCQTQLQALRDRCRSLGMAIGLYLDFAVGEAADGSGSWGSDIVLPDVRIGAPPDYFNEQGQDWGLAPLSPVAMAATRAAPFRELIGRATRQAGALRIDHAMGLWQLFLMPQGAGAADGTYARYPLADMLTALAEASRQNATTIIGEDLGNVPPGFRDVMEACRILSYRIFFFERDAQGFIPPKNYPREALACLSTHDLPTFRGWWRGDDVALREGFGFIGQTAADEQRRSRAAERADLLGDLVAAGLITAEAAGTIGPDDAPPALTVAVHKHLSRAPSRLFAVRLEDMAAELSPVNVPSTVDEYPNWRRKLTVPLDKLVDTPLYRDLAAALAAERPV